MPEYGPGFALRREGTCGSESLKKCIDVAFNFSACCPDASFCVQRRFNTYCCPSKDDCVAEVDDDPHCADKGWDLYDNNRHFCCEAGYVGYNRTRTDGCAETQDDLQDRWLPLPVIEAASTSSGPNVGAIAGGVVGGVAGLAIVAAAVWWFMRRRGRDSTKPCAELPARTMTPSPGELEGEPTHKSPPGLPQGHNGASELSGEPTDTPPKPNHLLEHKGASELPG